MIKKESGITIVALIVTIIIILILIGTVSSNIYRRSTSAYQTMKIDINILEDNILIYYNKYKEIPKTELEIEIGGIKYYEIDLSKLNNITLTHGKEYNKCNELTKDSDVYVVNDSLEVYYLKGAKESGEIKHN